MAVSAAAVAFPALYFQQSIEVRTARGLLQQCDQDRARLEGALVRLAIQAQAAGAQTSTGGGLANTGSIAAGEDVAGRDIITNIEGAGADIEVVLAYLDSIVESISDMKKE